MRSLCWKNQNLEIGRSGTRQQTVKSFGLASPLPKVLTTSATSELRHLQFTCTDAVVPQRLCLIVHYIPSLGCWRCCQSWLRISIEGEPDSDIRSFVSMAQEQIRMEHGVEEPQMPDLEIPLANQKRGCWPKLSILARRNEAYIAAASNDGTRAPKPVVQRINH